MSRRAWGILCLGLAWAAPFGCRTSATNDLWKDVPSSGDAGDPNWAASHATPDGGIAPPPGCVVDPASVTAMKSVDVPQGAFAMGCNAQVDTECKDDERPEHTVTLGAFAIDETEVTQAQYALCLQAGACTRPYCVWDPCKAPTLPIACIDYVQAQAYCAFAGERLPTEAEWEKAARSPDGRKYPWGNDPADCTKANMDGCGGVKTVASLSAGASSYGALDMGGNLVEWVADVYDPQYYAASPANDPPGPVRNQDSRFGGRGGGWRSEAVWQRASARDLYEWDYYKDSLGFRCAK
jgi:formylglycine-generating enzyme required for sulfatase activity